MAHDHCNCRDYTRSQLLHSAAAQAGQGLPSIEEGMPTPAGTGLSRRTFIFRCAGLALAVYGANKLSFDALSEGIARADAPDDRVLISLFFDGGIDSINVLAPMESGLYHDLRPNLGLELGPGSVMLEDTGDAETTLYWHPAAASLAELHAQGKVTVMPAIGYDHADQSHFTSRHYYEIGETAIGPRTGWLGRYIDLHGEPDNPLQGLSLAYNLSPALATKTNPVAAVASVTNYGLPNYVWDGEIENNMYDSFANLGNLPSDSAAMGQARTVTRQTAQLRNELKDFGANLGTPAGANYPQGSNGGVGDQLRSLAALLADDNLHLRTVTLSAAGGFDTHQDQAKTLADNLQETCDAVGAFQRDLELRDAAHGTHLADRVLIDMWSEFGRRPGENGNGTDHGAAGLNFLVGKGASGAVVGEFPGLAHLDPHDNLPMTTDFRNLYVTLMEDWLGVDAGPIIPGADGFAKYATLLG